MEKVLAMVTYAIGLLLGEAVRDRRYGVREETVFAGFYCRQKRWGIFILQDFFANYHTENIPCYIMMGKFLLWMRNFLTNKNCPN